MKFYLILAILAAFLIGCGGDNTELRWDNDAGSSVQDIQWMQNIRVDQRWPGETRDQQKTSLREVNALEGTGECLDFEGEAAIITARNEKGQTGVAMRLTENEANELIIAGVAKKKKSTEIEENQDNGLVIQARIVDRE